MTRPRILTGTDDFKTLLFNSDVFVDKSMLVKEILESTSTVLLIARPRRWGKSLNMDMIEKFFTIEVDQEGNPLPEEQRINWKLFAGGEVDLGLSTGKKKTLKKLKIAEHDDIMQGHQGQFPVISISFKDVKGRSYEEIEAGVKYQILRVFSKYKYLERYLKDTDNTLITEKNKEQLHKYLAGNINLIELKGALAFLSEILYKHFGHKVYILIDEYDTPINSAYIEFGQNIDEFRQVTALFGGIFGSALKDNEALEKGMVTGILRIAKASLFSDLNNVSEYTLLDTEFSELYGFTHSEVDELLSKVPFVTDGEAIKQWYNGYTFGDEIIYNPWSIMRCLAHKGKLDHYWLDSGGTGLVDKVLLSDEIQQDLQDLLEGRGIVRRLHKQISFADIENNKDVFYSLLVFAGYLNPKLESTDPEDPTYRLTIPNREVNNIYVQRIIGWVSKKLNIDGTDYENFVGLLINQKLEQFKNKFAEYLLESTSYHDLLKERDYHNLVGGILAPLSRKYMIDSNKEAGHGRFDHMLIPKESKGLTTAIILEYKIAESLDHLAAIAAEGLAQINAQQYDAKIKSHAHVKSIVKVSLSFYGKHLAMEYQVDQV
jgi:hypothetical protein